MKKRLYKVEEGKVLCGVCGGLALYFDVDPVLIRVLLVIFIFAGGSGIIPYIIAAILMPSKSEVIK